MSLANFKDAEAIREKAEDFQRELEQLVPECKNSGARERITEAARYAGLIILQLDLAINLLAP